MRVMNDSCTVAEDFKKEIKECYAPYSKSTEDKSSFRLENGTAWEYQTAEELAGRDIWGQVGCFRIMFDDN